jgi:hypothetical protein
MNTMKNVAVSAVTIAASAVAWIIGTCAAQTAWENGLGDKVAEKSKKLFSKKKEK